MIMHSSLCIIHIQMGMFELKIFHNPQPWLPIEREKMANTDLNYTREEIGWVLVSFVHLEVRAI